MSNNLSVPLPVSACHWGLPLLPSIKVPASIEVEPVSGFAKPRQNKHGL